MSKVESLLNSLQENVKRIDATSEKINSISRKKNLSEEDKGLLEILSRSEFSLAMDNSNIYEKLLKELKNSDAFTRNRLENEARKLLRVEIMEVQ